MLQRLGKGAQGSVYLVENKNDKKSYVLKKVECNDEGEANKAFKEAMALQELKHPFICGYKEFFVTWDKEESAMYVCIVMNYYELGDLSKVIKTKRQKHEKLDEMIVKKWVGQMMEGIVFVHDKHVIHRDLKPSNIFMTKNLNITIGDFGVSTVMGDARTRTRTTVGSMNWMAPEVMDRPYDERSDVWSLGCIILEMATCSTMDAAQISAALFEIKQDPQCLEDVLAGIQKSGYCTQLCQLIRTMLRRNFQQRPTAAELVAIPYVQECLLLNPETKLAKKKSAPHTVKEDVPKGKGLASVVKYMTTYADSQEAQYKTLEYLNTLITSEKEIDRFMDTIAKKLATAMTNHIHDLNIQIQACNIISKALSANCPGNLLYSKDMIHPVLLAMRSHIGSSELQAAACSILMGMSADENAAEIIGNIGGIQDILSAMRQFPEHGNIAATCCGALWSLAVNEGNAAIVTKERGLVDVCNAMERHSDSTDVVESACSAIWSLSLEDDNLDQLSDIGIQLIVEALNSHAKDERVVKNGFMALTSIITCGEMCAFRVLSPSPELVGLKIIISSYEGHQANPDITETFCGLIVELCEYEDVVKEIKSSHYQIKKRIEKISTTYKSHSDISSMTLSITKALNQ